MHHTQLTQPFTDYVTDQWVEGDRYFFNRYGTALKDGTANLRR